ncbi:SCO6880 family protein [Streptomyces chrestomyceticus]|uniref:SCO6880 family protein n=1 Tax=Streptomyces chrestomyceticus TaxID=68185 RepID=UPI0033E15B49
MSEQRTYVLGGETRKRTLFTGVSARQLAVLGVYLAVWVLALLVSQSLLVLVVGLVVLLAGIVLARRRTALGESWFGKVVTRITFTASSSEAPEYVPGETLPPEVGGVRVLAYAPPSAPQAPMAIIHHRNEARRSWGLGHLTATFEIQGTGDGMLPIRTVNTQGLLFERLLGGLASAEIPVDQLDISTRILPVHPAAYQEHMAGLVVPTAPARLRASMDELASYAAGNAEEYRSFATIRIPLQALQATAPGGPMDLEEVCEETFQVVGEVVRRVGVAGYGLRAVLGPRRLGALVRHLHDPDHSMDDLDGIDTFADGFNRLRYRGRDAARIEGTVRDWYHAVAHLPRDAWPADAVGARWMEHLVTQISPATIRTVTAQFRLVPKVRAREIAKVGLTYDTATKRNAAKRQQVSTGVTEASMSASQRTLRDLLRPVVGGVYPSVRVMVSAPEARQVAAARKLITGSAEDGGITRLDWQTYEHHKALITCMPMARGVRA